MRHGDRTALKTVDREERKRERVKCEEKYQIAQMLQDPNRKNGLHGSLS